ncbi:dihydroorotase [Neopusillimonas maritima]|jgi:dihydroorotase|uniref:Dihydroorotase n=1 Tax=Neopusillimonas maritima TaxID=2026239 RepID=A0ABX9MVJ4_9BURK|nr:dihydroorotase [Neopusillimonas maritima]MAL02574.1 dihydroorotase [Alcaligenaceae bacterium]RII82947.1 dihydroorotase [Neopusillimonas maritima]
MDISINSLTLTQPDDWHLHLRDGDILRSVLRGSVGQFGRAIVMPNLTPPVVKVEQAAAYRKRILQALNDTAGETQEFEPLMTLYLTDDTPPDEIYKAAESGIIYGVKLYPAGATTNSAAGVTDLLGRCLSTLEAMQKVGMPLLMHGEVTDPKIDIFDREAVFIDRVMIPLRDALPELKVVFEHLTTRQGAEYVRDAAGPIAATITPHHLLYNRNALFNGGIRPHMYCLPVLKREIHRQALLEAATGGSGRFFLGTDSAPHLRGMKESACGCAGCYTAPYAMALYATAFESVGKLDQLEAFASLNGPRFYGLPVNKRKITLERASYTIPDALSVGDDELVPLAAGETLPWRFADAAYT